MPSSSSRAKATGRPGEVLLHVYNLLKLKRVRFANAILRPLGTGAYHAAIEVYGVEYSFGFREGGTGVFARHPKGDQKHHYRQAISLGITRFSEDQVRQLVRQMQGEWQGDDYDLLRRNCTHFATALSQELGVDQVPKWVSKLGTTMAYLEDARDRGAAARGRRGNAVSDLFRGLLTDDACKGNDPCRGCRRCC